MNRTSQFCTAVISLASAMPLLFKSTQWKADWKNDRKLWRIVLTIDPVHSRDPLASKIRATPSPSNWLAGKQTMFGWQTPDCPKSLSGNVFLYPCTTELRCNSLLPSPAIGSCNSMVRFDPCTKSVQNSPPAGLPEPGFWASVIGPTIMVRLPLYKNSLAPFLS